MALLSRKSFRYCESWLSIVPRRAGDRLAVPVLMLEFLQWTHLVNTGAALA